MSQNKKSFSIGQIVYILSNQGQNIIPAMVIEEQTIQTLQGTNVSWKIAIGEPGEKQKIVDSTRLNGEIYTSLAEIKELLTKRLNTFIEQTIKLAKQREDVWYGRLRKESKILNKEPQGNKIDPESFLDDIEQNSSEFAQIVQEAKQMSVKEKLKSSIMPSREDLEKDVEDLKEDTSERFIVQGPDGNSIVANIR